MSWGDITKKRAREILKKYYTDEYKDTGVKGGKYLFNWCEEYKELINNCVVCCVTSEIDYIIKKSYEDTGAPLSYEDLDLFDVDSFIEDVTNNHKEEVKKWLIDSGFNPNETLKTLDKEDLKLMCDELNLGSGDYETEIYEWWVIDELLLYRLEQQGEVILNNKFWGRQTTGQSVSCDNSVIEAFISMLEDRFYLSKEDFVK